MISHMILGARGLQIKKTQGIQVRRLEKGAKVETKSSVHDPESANDFGPGHQAFKQPALLIGPALTADRGARRGYPYTMPGLLSGQSLIEGLAALGRQSVLHVVADGAESAKRCQEVVSASGTVGACIVASGRNTCGRVLIVGIGDRKVTRDRWAQHREHLRSVFCGCACGRCYLLDTHGGGLHNCGILHGICVDIVDAIVVTPADGIDL